MTTERDPKESNREQAQALVSWIYFSFFVGVSGWFFTEHFAVEENRDSQPTAAALAPLRSPPCSCPSAFTTSIHHLDLRKPFFFVFGSFFIFPFFFFFLLFNHFSSFLQRNSHWLLACRKLGKSSGTRGMVSFFHLAADLVEIIFPTRFFLLQK